MIDLDLLLSRNNDMMGVSENVTIPNKFKNIWQSIHLFSVIPREKIEKQNFKGQK